MTRLQSNILNQLMVQTPPGMVLTLDWLVEHNVSSKLAWWYVRSGWLERIGDKAFKKAGDHVSWLGAVAALHNQLHLPFHVGGKTAIQLLGKSHFIPMQGIKQISLFTNKPIKAPSWLLKKKLWDVDLKIHKALLFKSDELTFGIIERAFDGINIFLSSPERAAMEILHLVPHQESFEEALLILENLGQLRPNVVQQLLERCNSIKVKRLFLYFAERVGHRWLSELNLSKIDLGRGKRVIGQGGEYNSKYLISIPKIMEE